MLQSNAQSGITISTFGKSRLFLRLLVVTHPLLQQQNRHRNNLHTCEIGLEKVLSVIFSSYSANNVSYSECILQHLTPYYKVFLLTHLEDAVRSRRQF